MPSPVHESRLRYASTRLKESDYWKVTYDRLLAQAEINTFEAQRHASHILTARLLTLMGAVLISAAELVQDGMV